MLNVQSAGGLNISNYIGAAFLSLFLIACGGGGGGGDDGGGGGTTQYTLTVTVSGSGSVASDDSGIDCGSDCSQAYNSGIMVALTATPAAGYSFSGWSGACTGTSTCQVTMSQNQAVTATFTQDTQPVDYTLTVNNSGGGTVTSQPTGIDCGSDCTESYAENTDVTLTAVANSGFSFSGWSGACSGTSTCQVSMTQNQQVTATFTEDAQPGEFTLVVTNNGGGAVTSDPAGIDCGSDCSQNYMENTDVTLTATADSGYTFTGWSGDCSGTSTCQLSMSENRAATATFTEDTPTEYTLTITKSSGGSVTSQPAGIDCGNDCTEVYATNTSVTLTATPDQGYTFSGWGGDDCTGQSTCALTMNADKAVTATFATSAGALSIADMGMHEVDHGTVFQYQPQINGEFSICRKDMGHDDVKVDSETGAISWDTSGLTFGRGFHIRIKCSSYTESVYAAMVVHVDYSGTSRLRVAGEDGVSEYIRVAGRAMTGGDTIVFPDGVYPVSVSGDATYENAFKRNAPTPGTATQLSTLIARNPGQVVISGTANGNIGKQKNAFEFGDISNVAMVGFQIENVQRSSVTSQGSVNKVLIEFVGAAGAGTNLRSCSNFSEAASGECSNAGMRLNDGNPLFQNSYDWGHNRYGIMTNRTSGSITRRSFVRLDEHKGDQPYGGFSNYCDSAHLSQDNTVFDSLAIAAPHYKNYAGLEAYPATGCENDDATLKTEGLLAVNNDLSLSLMDQKAGPVHVWDYIVSYDSKGTCTPQTGYCGNLLLQADKETHVFNSFFGQAVSFDSSNTRAAFDTNDVVLDAATVAKKDVEGDADVGDMPEYLPESLLYFRGRSDTFYGDTNYDQLTNVRRWPIGGEDIIAAKMRSYDNPNALKVGGGTVHIDGNRGAVAEGESMSEYFWGYINQHIPPLVVRVKDKGASKRVAWEHLSGSRRDAVTGWKVVCATSGNSVLATLAKEELTYNHTGSCSGYAVIAVYADGESGIAYTETAE
ncbi:InlB B-repeat-containing protein [Aliikangiella coralliicola]|nr:InlB B-repeat-containing protein [Aliikangiella coralliicola]